MISNYYENPAAQSFFAQWREINDSIQPKIISRDEWEKRGIKSILEKRPDLVSSEKG